MNHVKDQRRGKPGSYRVADMHVGKIRPAIGCRNELAAVVGGQPFAYHRWQALAET